METKLTKTDRFLNLFRTLLTSEAGITDIEFRDILGNPSKSQYHKYLVELTQKNENRVSILIRTKTANGFHYQLNHQSLELNQNEKKKPQLTLVENASFCELRVFKPAIETFKSLHLACDLLAKYEDYNHYKVRFTNIDEFINKIFSIADSIEVLGHEQLKAKFVEKAKMTLLNNSETEIHSLKKVG